MDMRAALRLTDLQLDVMRAAAAEAHPEEACGILVGRPVDSGAGVVARVVPTRNASTGDRTNRYEIPPADLVREQRESRREGTRILGFYHSHPDGTAAPSSHDRGLAWPEYIYVIVPVRDGVASEPRAWQLADDRSAFAEVGIELFSGSIR